MDWCRNALLRDAKVIQANALVSLNSSLSLIGRFHSYKFQKHFLIVKHFDGIQKQEF
jgi:hypothetical protein